MFEVGGRQREDGIQREREVRGRGVEYKRTVPCGFSYGTQIPVTHNYY